MGATKNKTTITEESITGYLSRITDSEKRKDFSEMIELFRKQSGLEPRMWGTAIVGFGTYHYKYESGREGDAPLVALAARSSAITLYLPSNFERREELLLKLGKYKTGKGCIYIQKPEDIDKTILGKMIKKAIEHKKHLKQA